MSDSAVLSVFDKIIDEALDATLMRYQVPGAAIAAIAAGEPLIKLYGIERDGGPPVSPGSRFSCGSTSKAFVSALGAALTAKKVVDWDAPIANLVPEWQMPEEWQRQIVSFRDLCGNRSGVSRRGVCEYGADLNQPIAQTFSRLKHTPVVAPFRSHFSYLNLGHTAAAIGFGRSAGQSFTDALRGEVLTPLAMHDTLTGLEARAGMDKLCGWHRELAGTVGAIEPRLSQENELGGSGVLTSARDALKWLKFQVGSSASGLPAELATSTHEPTTLIPTSLRDPSYATKDSLFSAYALGWAVSELDGHRIVRHGGNDPGMSAHIALAPDKQTGVAVYLNRHSKYCAMECSYRLLGHLLGIQRDWQAMLESHFASEWEESRRLEQLGQLNETAVRSDDATAYAGYYDCPYSGPAHVYRDTAGLHLRIALSRYHSGRLKQIAENRFLLIGSFDSNLDSIVDEVSFSARGGNFVMDAGWAGEFTRITCV